MNKALVDTDVASYMFKKDSCAETYARVLENYWPFISFVTLAELRRWPLQRGWGAGRTADFEKSLSLYAVLFASEDTCRHWAMIASVKGRPISYHGSWIAATALEYNVPLLTNNRKDFESIAGLVLLSPDTTP